MLNLKEIVKKSQEGFDSISDPTIVLSLSKFEEFVNDAYEGRLFFELIQNARDAAFQKGVNSDIKIIVKEENVLFANTGRPFDEKGVIAMTRLGLSDKSDNGLIGNKGIGFKAIQDFTKKVKIITEFGTFYFDREELKNKLNIKFPDLFNKELSIPLFYYPHFDDVKNNQMEDFTGEYYDTIIDFELDKTKTKEDIVELYDKITDEELILLGNVNTITFQSTGNEFKKRTFTYSDDNYIQVKNNDIIKNFKVFSPKNKIEIPDSVFDELEENDKKLFEKDRSIDIKLVFEYSDKNSIVINLDSKLFLYYPLEIVSGFPYIIHSNFSCNPERTSIKDTRLNDYLFDQITTMQTTQIFDYLVENKFKSKLIEFLYFEKGKEEKLKPFYKMYVEKLKHKKLIWIEYLKEYLSPDNIVFCPKEIYSFLKNHKVDDKYLYTCEEPIKSFLIDNFQVASLTKKQIFDHIEEFCYKEITNPAFFNKLYSICISNDISVTNRKVLLGSNSQLYSSEEDVFYVSNKSSIKIPSDINNKLIVLHPHVKIEYEDINKGSRLLGFKEFRAHDLVEKALSLFNNSAVNNFSILEFLEGLENLTSITKDLIYRKIFIPIKDKKDWIQPIYNPVYFDTVELRELYPKGSFIDIEQCVNDESDFENWKSFFQNYGVWEIPAMFFMDKISDTISDKKRTSKINNQTGKSAYGYFVHNDRMLDVPEKVNYFFYNSIFSNWSYYEEKIKNQSVLEFKLRSTAATYADKDLNFIGLTSFVKSLLDNPWVFLGEDHKEPFTINEIFGLDRIDAINEKHLPNNLNIIILDFQLNKSFITTLGIRHFNAFSSNHMLSILKMIAHIYEFKTSDLLETDFKRFYHIILKYLYNTFVQIRIESERELFIRELKNTKFLCKQVSGISELIAWEYPVDIYHVDERIAYDNLPIEAKEILKYYFTKSDKNEIGKIFSRIGKRISDEVIERITLPDVYTEYFFIEKIVNIPYIIIAVEDKIENHLSENVFNKLKDLKIRISKDDLEKQITLKSDSEFEIYVPLNYFFDKQENAVYISSKDFPIIDSKSLLGEILNYILSSYAEKELGINRLIKDLSHTKNSKTFSEAIQDLEYDKERVTEIELIFNENKTTPQQAFWGAILFAKGIVNSDTICLLIADNNIEILFNNLVSNKDLINNWFDNLNYIQLNSSQNFSIISEILYEEKISFEDINARLSTIIDFEYLYKKDFNVYKNRNSKKIKWLLFTYYNENDVEFQKSFHDNTIQFEKLEPRAWETVQWEFKIEEDLVKELNYKYPNLGLTTGMIDDIDEDSWITLINNIPKRRKSLKGKLLKLGFDMINFEGFISQENNYSLLYFEHYDLLKEIYIKQFPKVEKAENFEELLKLQFPIAENDDNSILDCNVKSDSLNSNSSSFDAATQKMNNHNGSRGSGASSPNLLNQDYLNHIGKEGERLMFLKLCDLYKDNVTWASENAICMGFVPDKEAVGYDIRYVDNNNETHYIEVKTSTHEQPEFHISINEIRSARKHGLNYHVIWITNLFDKSRRQYFDLKNMFIDFNEGEDFFHNSKFFPQLTGFKIIFKPETIKSIEHKIKFEVIKEADL